METTHDAFLGGAVHIEQPKTGYRAGQDPVLLAAACGIEPGQSFVDLGCGVGTVGLCLHARVGDLRGQGIERDPWLAQLAETNGLTARQGDIFTDQPTAGQGVDWALSNPPFFEAGAGRQSPNLQRQAGRHGHDIAGWIRATMAWVRPRGRLGLILNSAQVPDAMAALTPAFGGLTLMPVQGKDGAPMAERCLLFARQGSRSPFVIAPALVIRDGCGGLTRQADGVLSHPRRLGFPPIK